MSSSPPPPIVIAAPPQPPPCPPDPACTIPMVVLCSCARHPSPPEHRRLRVPRTPMRHHHRRNRLRREAAPAPQPCVASLGPQRPIFAIIGRSHAAAHRCCHRPESLLCSSVFCLCVLLPCITSRWGPHVIHYLSFLFFLSVYLLQVGPECKSLSGFAMEKSDSTFLRIFPLLFFYHFM